MGTVNDICVAIEDALKALIRRHPEMMARCERIEIDMPRDELSHMMFRIELEDLIDRTEGRS
jgi:hypothetical protein